MREGRHWQRDFPREVVDAPALTLLKAKLDVRP